MMNRQLLNIAKTEKLDVSAGIKMESELKKLNRFFSLHFVLPFVLAALALMHLIVLHDTAGSGNPLGVSGNYERISFAPYFIFKDLITIFIFIFVLSLFVFFMPNVLGDSENYVMANPMQTPPAIVPE